MSVSSRSLHRNRLARLTLCGTTVAVLHTVTIGTAEARARVSADAAASVVASSNPFFASGTDTGAVATSLSLRPSLVSTTATDEVRLSALYERIDYISRYPSIENYGANIAARRQIDPMTSVSLSGDVNSRIAVQTGDLLRQFDGTAPVVLGFSDIDATVLSGIRQRTVQYRANVGAVHQPTANDRLRVDFAASANRFPNGGGVGLRAFDFYSSSIGYQRTVSRTVSVGGTISVAKSDFRASRIGDGTVITPQASLEARVGTRLTLRGGLGAAITRTNTLTGEVSGVFLAGDLSACWTIARGQACLSGSRSAQPTALDGIRVQTGVALNGSYKLSARTQLRGSARYTRASQALGAVALGGAGFGNGALLGAATFASLGASVERQLDRRTALFVSTRYDTTSGGFTTRRSNYEGSVGVRFRIGAVE